MTYECFSYHISIVGLIRKRLPYILCDTIIEYLDFFWLQGCRRFSVDRIIKIIDFSALLVVDKAFLKKMG